MVIVTSLALSAGTAWLRVGRARGRAAGRPDRRADLATVLANLDARPSATVGTRLALDSRTARGAPVRLSSGAAAGIAGVVAVLGFVASLDRLVQTPARSGWPAEIVVADVDDATLDRLGTDASFDAVAR